VRMIESRQPIHVNMRTGTVMSLAGTATGKVFAAFMPEEKLTHLKSLGLGHRVSHGDLELDTEQLTDQELKQIRSQGIACAMGKPIPGVNALSVGVFDQSASLCLVITALGPAVTFPVDIHGHIAQSLIDAADEISRRLGYLKH
jgi:DNA-binding IclR family transcriptional regulator